MHNSAFDSRQYPPQTTFVNEIYFGSSNKGTFHNILIEWIELPSSYDFQIVRKVILSKMLGCKSIWLLIFY